MVAAGRSLPTCAGPSELHISGRQNRPHLWQTPSQEATQQCGEGAPSPPSLHRLLVLLHLSALFSCVPPSNHPGATGVTVTVGGHLARLSQPLPGRGPRHPAEGLFQPWCPKPGLLDRTSLAAQSGSLAELGKVSSLLSRANPEKMN